MANEHPIVLSTIILFDSNIIWLNWPMTSHNWRRKKRKEETNHWLTRAGKVGSLFAVRKNPPFRSLVARNGEWGGSWSPFGKPFRVQRNLLRPARGGTFHRVSNPGPECRLTGERAEVRSRRGQLGPPFIFARSSKHRRGVGPLGLTT